ncbi:UDP-2,3-diacylglucosamine diphosphatase [Acidimangrovimonas pyrenivorans]|uniref:UDP-2,3-diacylglucosamine diphosphatase n=1 Tax=Acidimangrovimonas pyrenivorans TaxID=2030798 RepID=A0ABV7AFT6_9RHOB
MLVHQHIGLPLQYRTIFISDTHLGSRGSQAEMLLDFLRQHDAETIFLVGDIVDAWQLRRGWFWPQAHNDVVQELLSKSQAGATVIYIPGNHDEAMRSYLGTHFGGIEVQKTAEHITADGRRLLVTHGDQFDAIVVHAKWLAHLGDRAYDFALWLNIWVNRLRRLWGGSYWSLANWAKAQVKTAVNFIGEYEKVLSAEARRGGFDGVVCGHIHRANLRDIDGIQYVNCGDWTESCTAVAERPDGTLLLVDWAAAKRRRRMLQEVRAGRPLPEAPRARRKRKKELA